MPEASLSESIDGAAAVQAGVSERNRVRTARDDRILPLTRAVAVIVVPFLLVAFGVLYVRPENAAALFAWPVKPQLTAMLLGAAYLGGIAFFSLLLAARLWHRVALGLPAVATFATLLLVTTLLHLDLFSFERVAGWTWTLIYVVAPPLVVAAYVLNRRRDPGRGPGDALVPAPLLRALLGIGLATMAFAIVLYAVPGAFVDVWPWKITPLSARVLASMLCLPGVQAIGMALDRRRSSMGVPLVAQAVALVAMLAAFWIRREDLTGPAASVALAWLVIAGSLAGTVAMLLAFRERPDVA
jgi:hypothetical protein